MTARGRRSLLFAPLLAVAWLAPPLLARAAPTAGFEETSQVVAVEVPVNVTGRDGKPVRGLTAADFEVFDEGAPQRISHFEVADLEVQEPAAGRPVAPPTVQQPGARRRFLLLFDLAFSTPTAVIKARVAAREFVLHSLRPGDLAGIAAFSLDTGPRLVVTFTADRAQLARGIETLGLHAGEESWARNDPLRFMISPASEAALAAGLPELPEVGAKFDGVLLENLQAIRSAAQRSEKTFAQTRVDAFLRSMSDTARELNAVPGRKHIVFFSEGFDSKLLLGRGDPLDAAASADNANVESGALWLVDTDNRYGNTVLQSHVQRMLEAFQRADCVIEAVDIGGLRAGGDTQDEPRASGREGLFVLANGTGGELFNDANDFGGQLQHLLERTSVTYLLTFERGDLKPDGAWRRLRVKAKVPAGAHLSYRTGYRAPRPYRQLDPLERTLLAADGIVSATPRGDLDVDLLVAPFRSNDKAAYVPVILEVGGGRLLARQKGEQLNVEVYAYVSDQHGEMKDFLTQHIALDLKRGRAALAAAGLKYYGHLELAPGDYEVRVLVRNAETGATGVRSASLFVPAFSQAPQVLLQPFFIEEGSAWVMVRERTPEGTGGSVVYPFTVNGEPYVPAARPDLSREAHARLCLVGYNLGDGDLALRAWVTAPDGRVLPGGSLSLVERTATGIAGLDKLLATFQPSGLAAGSYVLEIGVKNGKTGKEEVNSLPFRVR